MSKDKIQNTLTGTFWSMTERVAKIGIQVLCTFIIAQFVAPSAFGLVSMMSIFLAFSTMLIDSGFSQAIIHERRSSGLTSYWALWSMGHSSSRHR